MEELNQKLFLLINASAHPDPTLLMIARLCAEQLIWLIPIAVLIGWLYGAEDTRKIMLQATMSAIIGMLVSQLIGVLWPHPRPFMIGLGHNYVAHVADSSFPSDHLTLLWTVAFSFILHRRTRVSGIIFASMGISVAWARIYVGVHFPGDMLGAVGVAVISAGLGLWSARWYLGLTFRWATVIHRRLFAPLIRRGWLMK